VVPTESPPTAGPVFTAPAPTEEPAEVDSPTDSEETRESIVENFSSVLLTFIFPAGRRRTLRSLTETLSIQSRAELYVLTQDHLLATIDNLQGLELGLTPYQEVAVDGQIAVTQVLKGSLVLNLTPTEIDSLQVQALLHDAFRGDNLNLYLETLRSLAEDSVLNTVLDISYGIPLGIPDTVSNPQSSDGLSSPEPESEDAFEWNAMWIAVMSFGFVGLVGLLVVGYVVLSRHSEGFQSAVGVIKSSLTGGSFSPQPSPSSTQPVLVRRMESMEDGEDVEMKLDDDALPEITREEDVVFGDMQSEITSVCSYMDRTGLIESVLADDQSYSLPPSFLMRASKSPQEDETSTIGGGDQDSSVLWSVMDGLGDHSVIPPSTSPLAKQNHQSMSKNHSSSPSELVISAGENDLYIFNDDEVSLVSEQSEMMTSRILNVQTEDGRPASPIRAEATSESFRHSLRQNKSTSLDGSLNESQPPFEEEKAVAEKQMDLTSILRSKDALPSADLSHVMEASEASTSHASTASRRSAPSSAKKNRSRSLLSDGRKSAPNSAKKDRSMRSKSLNSSKESGIASEDDSSSSSLFMGPDAFSKENAGNKVLSLLETNKVDTSTPKNTYQIAPLFRGGIKRLSSNDKKRMGLRTKRSVDDDSLGESMILPGSYGMADFRDDMSISTVGSTIPLPRGNYPDSAMASF
jgi:hypothetical protein